MKSKKNKKVEMILDQFSKLYPDPKCELNYETEFQLLVATILSAQATDKKVNEVTAGLFKILQGPEDFLALGLEGLEESVKQLNLFRTKAKHIIETCHLLITKHQGKVPDSMEELILLPGVGRKTANVVLSNAFNIPAIAVDTHVFRVSNRIGLVKACNVLKTELELEQIIPKEQWSKAHNYLVLHGRRFCIARNPKCEICPLSELCTFATEARKSIESK